ncbi:hypothetical protein GCM10011571_00090 [Marinithermofilum abyssi]|uniref:Tetratrico peptide repeat group 5 domain-containing protein n=1 Tax=Marinithermofilum abyssi TaxID=1571185 RepID=A0A8J2VEZ1_9BACL|nr:tetratricopeptide repeat protein [Marinithermofilum abyssi]GGE03264.1 hypothetical protein GCM10011571_00090 [Marinithermofilum abyssi]
MNLERARQLRISGQLEEANELLEQLRLQFPDNATVLLESAFVCDSLGQEKKAVPYYQQAIDQGLEREDLQEAYLGLGSTYRCLGRYEEAVTTLRQGCALFPEDRGMRVFLALALYNRGKADQAVEILLNQLLETTQDPSILKYRRALSFYADKLDQTWE